MSSFRIHNHYGSTVKLVRNNAKRGFVGKLFPNGRRRSQAQSDGAGGGNGPNGIPEMGRGLTKKASSKIQRTPTHMRFDNVRGDELIVMHEDGRYRTFRRDEIISHKWNDMHNGHMRLQLNVECE